MSGLEVPFAIAGFVVGLILRAGREREAKLLEATRKALGVRS